MARTDPQNRARYWADRSTTGLSLLHADFRTQRFAPHRHEGFVVAVTERGGSVIRCRGAEGEVHPRVLSVFSPMDAHSGGMGTSRHWRYRALYLERDAVEEVRRGLGVDAVPRLTGILYPDRDLIDAFLALHRALVAGRDALHDRELLVTTFGTLFRRHGGAPGLRIEPGPRDRRRLGLADELMRADLAGRPRLGELAAALDLTEYQLTSLFKLTTGLTPYVYLTQLRLDAARRDLSRGVPIAETAIRCGFSDQSALTGHFKRRYGLTPLQFASAARR